MPKKEDRERKKLVVEEVETPVTEDVVSSTELEKEEAHSEIKPEPETSETPEEAKNTESETPKEEIEKEIQTEEKHLHDIHTNMPPPVSPMRPGEKQGSPILWILIPGIFLLGGLLGGIVFYQKGINKGETETPSPTPIVSIEASATPSATMLPKAELSKYPIRIENGSGIPGAAGDAKTFLTKAGFKVASTGNASTYDYTDTIIQAKSNVPKSFLDALGKSLSATYSLGKTTTLADTSTEDVVVIIGSSKAQ